MRVRRGVRVRLRIRLRVRLSAKAQGWGSGSGWAWHLARGTAAAVVPASRLASSSAWLGYRGEGEG